MLDFTPVRKKEMTISELVDDLTIKDLRDLTNEMIDLQLSLLANCRDKDVIFEPIDSLANDQAAENDADVDLAWNLGHLIVHTTASSEEGAFLAAETARGVQPHDRSRSEIAWQKMTTVGQCVQRLEESRRMRLASLDMWPDAPFLDFEHEVWPGMVVKTVGRFVLGLYHDDGHIAQFKEVIRQAQTVPA